MESYSFNLLKDISQYFELLKHTGQKKFNISDKSKTIINELGLVFEGDENSKIYIIDSKATFFSGEPGSLLLKILKAMDLSKKDICICDVSYPDAVRSRIDRIKPKVVITLGDRAAKLIFDNNNFPQYFKLENFRGRLHDFKGVKIMPTFHPLSLIDNQEKKRDVWNDMKIVMKYLEL